MMDLYAMPIELTLPWPPRVLNPNQRAHWAVKAKAAKAYKAACWALAMEAKWPEFEWDGVSKVNLWLAFYPPDRRHYDDDNCVRAFKAGRDGVALALGIDDRNFRMHPLLHTDIGGFVKVKISGGP